MDHDVKVTELVLEGVAHSPVEERSAREFQLMLKISLLVILLHFVVEPFEVQDRALAGGAVVRSVETHVQNQLFVFCLVVWELFGAQSALKSHYKVTQYGLLICVK